MSKLFGPHLAVHHIGSHLFLRLIHMGESSLETGESGFNSKCPLDNLQQQIILSYE